MRHQKVFPIKEHGTWEAAEQAAGVWIRQMERALPSPITAKKGVGDVRYQQILARRSEKSVV